MKRTTEEYIDEEGKGKVSGFGGCYLTVDCIPEAGLA